MIQQNFLSPIGFQFTIHRLPNVSFFVQEATIPSIGMEGNVNIPTPFQYIKLASDKIDYGDFRILIRMDEDLNAYTEILDWITGLTKPDSYTEYANLQSSQDGLYSDATLTILNARGNPHININLYKIFPYNISEMVMNTTDTDVNYISAEISFKHNGFTVSKI